ncbi:FtsB family cell division protein [Geminisphaera colitermitum]|uniref:FtsB family cell division protein n=1 Tax=Geminisphaera colitermitum TaxID=1148786 RepID=UPI0001965036|nr:septum formation initiator family protein [Geminisphaera colitermitum]
MILRRAFIVIYVVLLVGGITIAGLFFWQTRREYNHLKEVHAQTALRLAETKARLDEQNKILERLRTDPVYIEMEIRRRLGYAKPEEFVFRFQE